MQAAAAVEVDSLEQVVEAGMVAIRGVAFLSFYKK
jgi:hypothetical protein